MLLLISGFGDETRKLEFEQIYEQNYRTMYYVALKILKNKEEAEDAVHSAFVKLAEKYDTYRHLTPQEMTSLCWNERTFQEIEMVGLCTDICVVSNALILKATFPSVEITVDASCCAGVTPQTHLAALETMKMCQILVTGE